MHQKKKSLAHAQTIGSSVIKLGIYPIQPDLVSKVIAPEIIDLECIVGHGITFPLFTVRARPSKSAILDLKSSKSSAQRALDRTKFLAIGDWDEAKCPSRSALTHFY